MSHEIRTPLTAVMGFASVLSETKLDKTQRRYLHTVINASERLVALLNDILDFSKIEDGKLILERVPFVPALIAHEVTDLYLPKAAEKRLVLHFDNQLRNPLTVEGDPTRIRQILLNLVGNAIKFTDRGSVTLHASWLPPAANSPAGTLILKVIDTGIGISPTKLRALFNSFDHASPSTGRRVDSSGLGLAICKRLVDLMGGRIHVESTLGNGSTFTVSFPCPQAHSGTVAPQPSAIETISGAATTKLGRVLVADDQELNRELMRVLVRRLGYDADLATNGEEAAALATSRPYAAIFMDVDMPGMSGIAAATKIRSVETDRRVPIIAVTAVTIPGTREKCLAAGMDDYLTKPVYMPALKSALDAMTAR